MTRNTRQRTIWVSSQKCNWKVQFHSKMILDRRKDQRPRKYNFSIAHQILHSSKSYAPSSSTPNSIQITQIDIKEDFFSSCFSSNPANPYPLNYISHISRVDMSRQSRLNGKCTSYWCRFCGTNHKQFPCPPFGLWHPIVSCLYGNPPHRGPCEPPGPGGWWPDVKREVGQGKWCCWVVFILEIEWDW